MSKSDHVLFRLLGGPDGETEACKFVVKDCSDCPFRELLAWKAYQTNCKLKSFIYKENLECSFKDVPDGCPLLGEKY